MGKVSRSIIAPGLIAAFTHSAHVADTYPASGRINGVDDARGEVNITHGTAAGEAFRATCARCHALPDPAQHTAPANGPRSSRACNTI